MSIEDLIPGSRYYLPVSIHLFLSSQPSFTRYKFRIKAENAYGISDESQESDPFDVHSGAQGGAPAPVEPR